MLRGAAGAAVAAVAAPIMARAASPLLTTTPAQNATITVGEGMMKASGATLTTAGLSVIGRVTPALPLAPVPSIGGDALPPSFATLLARLDPTLSVDDQVQKFARVFGATMDPPLEGATRLESLDASWIKTLIDHPEFPLLRRLPYQATFNSLGMRYTGVRRGVTHTFVPDPGPVVEEQMNGLLELAERGERTLLWGDRRLRDAAANEVVADGFVRQAVDRGMAIDAHGAPFSTALLDRALEKMQAITPIAPADQRWEAVLAPASLKGYTQSMGGMVTAYISNFGFVSLFPSLFTERVDGGHPVLFEVPGVPDSPLVTRGSIGRGMDNGGFPSDQQRPFYWVAAVNAQGESVARAPLSAPLESLDARWMIPGRRTYGLHLPTNPGATAFRIYRHDTSPDVTQAGIIDEVSIDAGPDDGQGRYWKDTNAWLPNTDIAIVYNRDPRDLVIERLMPILQFPLKTTSTSMEFLLLNYAVPRIQASGHVAVITNIGRDA
jgi:hypothetical protein